MSRYTPWMLSSCLCVLVGCPLPTQDNNTPLPDIGRPDMPPDAVDMPQDTSEEMSEDATPDQSVDDVTCLTPWPETLSIAREGDAPLTLLTLCQGASDWSKGQATLTYEGAELASEMFETSDRGDGWTQVRAQFTLPSRPGGKAKKIPGLIFKVIRSVSAPPITLTAQTVRTHISDDGVRELDGPLASATLEEDEVSTIAAENPIFQAPAGASNNILASKPGGGSSVWSAAYDEAKQSLVLYEQPVGGGAKVARAERPMARFDAAHLRLVQTSEDMRSLFIITQCFDGPGVEPCTAPLNFAHTDLTTNYDLTGFSDAELTALDGLPPATFGEDTAIVAHTEVLAKPGGPALRLLYGAQNLETATAQWAVLDIETSQEPGLTLSTEALLPDIGGVTPEAVASGEANIGILRAPMAPSLDPLVPTGPDTTIPWISVPTPGGATFRLPFVPEFQEVEMAGVDAGSAELHAIPWAQGRAVVLTGLERDKLRSELVPRAQVGLAFEAGDITWRPLAIPPEVLSEDIGGFGVVSGPGGRFALHPKPPRKKVRVDAVGQAHIVSSALVYEAGGDTSSPDPYESKGEVPELMADGSGPYGVPFITPGGVALSAPVDLLACETPGACDIPRAATADGFIVGTRYSGSASQRQWYYKTAAEADTKPLFSDAPGYAFLLSKRTAIFRDAGSNGHAIILPYRNADGEAGLYFSKIAPDGSVTSQSARSLKDGDREISLAGADMLAYDGARGVAAVPKMGGWSLFSLADDTIETMRVHAVVDVTYANAAIVEVPRVCPMSHPSCALASTSFGATPGKTYRVGEPGPALATGVKAGDAPSIIVVARHDTGLACELATLLYPSVGEGDPIVVSTSDRRDCADLAIPVGADDVMGEGGEAFVLLRRTETGGVVSVVFLAEDVSGVLGVYHEDVGQVGAALNVGVAGAARSVALTDINDDGLADLLFEGDVRSPRTGSLVLGDGAGGVWLGGGRSSFLRAEPLRLPGLEVQGAGGLEPYLGRTRPRGGRSTRIKDKILISR